MGADRPPQHLGHPGVALDDGGGGLVLAPDLDAGAHQVVDGGLLDLQLPEGGQHLFDVVEEGTVRPDDQGAGAGEPLAVRVQQVRHPVQAHGGLPGAGPALHADRAAESAADDLVLLGLDGGDDVAHRADAGPFDLRLEEAAGLLGLGGVGEVLVLVRGQLAAGVAEAAAQPHVLGAGAGRLVVRLGDRRAPVDDHGVAGGVVDVPAADVEPLAVRPLGQVAADGVQVVEAAEEQRGVREIGERLDAVVDLGLEHGGVDPVRGDVADVEGLDVLAHPAQRGARRGEMGAFALQRVVGIGWGIACRYVRGHGAASGSSTQDGGPRAEAGRGRCGGPLERWMCGGVGRFPSGRRRSPGCRR